MKALKLWCLVLLVGGCGTPWPEVTRGDQELRARRIVWAYYHTDWPPPVVEWWYTTCPGAPDNPNTAVVGFDGACYAGLFEELPYKANVAWRGSYSASAYAHELMHAWQFTRNIYDPDHMLPEWGMIPTINAALAKEGL